MRRSFPQENHVHFSEGRHSDDYYGYVSKLEKMPSTRDDGPHFPNIHVAFKTRPTYDDNHETKTVIREEFHNGYGPRGNVEYFEKTTERVPVHMNGGGHRVDRKMFKKEEEDINVAAMDFIKHKHEILEMEKRMSM